MLERLLACLFLVSILFVFTGHCHSQDRIFGSVTGVITDASDGQPLYFANVFLSGTMLGAATDEEGRYTIYNVPLSGYELVVTMMGYEMAFRQIRLTDENEIHVELALNPKVLDAPALSVTAPSAGQWENYYETFIKHFLGNSKNALACTILNPEVLDFNFDDESGVLVAFSDIPLKIENRALGYLVELYLDDLSLKSDVFIRAIYRTRFEALTPQDEVEANTWKRNKLEAYFGSLHHFLAALVYDRLYEEGFFVYETYGLRRQETNETFTNTAAKQLLKPATHPHERRLAFPEYLKIVYVKENEAQEFLWETQFQQTGQQVSWIKMNVGEMIISTAGLYSNPYAITTFGYMAWERFANVLPIDEIERIQSEQNFVTRLTGDLAPSDKPWDLGGNGNNYHLRSVYIGPGLFSPWNDRFRHYFGSVPTVQAGMTGRLGSFLLRSQIAYGMRSSINHNLFVRRYDVSRVVHYTDIALHFYRLQFDLLYQINREGGLRFVSGPGVYALQLAIDGRELQNLAGGQIYGSEILDDAVGGGIGWSYAVGVHIPMSRFEAQIYMQYFSGSVFERKAHNVLTDMDEMLYHLRSQGVGVSMSLGLVR